MQFKTNAVFIPTDAVDPVDGSVDPRDCTLLMVDGDNNDADVWEKDNHVVPFCRRERGKFVGYPPGGTVEFIPELWVVKIDETEYWHDEVRSLAPRIYGVYVFNRKKHVYACSTEATYELTFLGSQYVTREGLDDASLEELDDQIRDGDGQCEDVYYFGVRDIDRMLETVISEGQLPPGQSGGCRITGLQAVTEDDAVEEIREYHNANGGV